MLAALLTLRLGTSKSCMSKRNILLHIRQTAPSRPCFSRPKHVKTTEGSWDSSSFRHYKNLYYLVRSKNTEPKQINDELTHRTSKVGIFMTKTHYPLPKTPRRDNSPIFFKKTKHQRFHSSSPKRCSGEQNPTEPNSTTRNPNKIPIHKPPPARVQATTPYP